MSKLAKQSNAGGVASLLALGYASKELVGTTTNTEVIINTTIYNTDQIVLQRSSDIYYINDLDSSHYKKESVTQMEVVAQ
ncbi:MAG: hypothetical protein HN932_09920 [Candidatus Marinimicrobia bacterium]|nr:hypothetical protein [Gammaproteobacteria bacterium]MBT5236148.1 hypothetical protein [Candidatus Neomarinimicrobiota bacterium]MBT6651464.1 hypothetical protein [Gammaproteobacteria bacterium]MBT7090782.1 hypothetical protein [Candidatus Neomarinimicrobiota bacterium]HIJ23807.1 hypothetical protein [Gammaproteobacteria bacterium]